MLYKMETVKKLFCIIREHRTGILIALCTGLLIPYFVYIAGYFSDKYFSTKKIEYEILLYEVYKKPELNKIANREHIRFSFDLDDPFIDDYKLVKVKLSNKGPFIDSPLALNISSLPSCTKIIDIRHKIMYPKEKFLNITYSLPQPTKDFLEENHNYRMVIGWNPSKNPSAHCIYKSINKFVGYGRINDEVITSNEFSIDIDSAKNNRKFYICISALTRFGESILSNPIEVSNIQQYYISRNIFDIENGKDFMEGKTKVLLNNGLDEEAEIYFYILCKIDQDVEFNMLEDYELKLDIILQGEPQIIFQGNKTELKKNHTFNKKEPDTELWKYAALTPEKVTSRSDKKTIYIIWKKPQNADYEGIKIFRSDMRNYHDLFNVGEEIYDGYGSEHQEFGFSSFVELDDMPIDKHDDNQIFKPKRKKPQPKICPPNLISIKAIQNTNNLSKNILCYEDNEVNPKLVYTYTIYAYNKEGYFSFPIVVNASLTDCISNNCCYSKNSETTID